ncbi:MAG: PASTA domain-containing protein [Deinococcales bacterium]
MVGNTRTAAEVRQQTLRRRRFRLIAVATLLVVVALFAAVSVRDYFTVGEVRLPDVVGMRYPDAVATLRQAGLQAKAFVDNVPGAGMQAVTTQAPDAGTVVRQDRVIHVGVNNPPAQTKVPQLVGMTEAQALKRASQLRVPITSLTYAHDSHANGVVIGQTPDAGVELQTNQQLTLTVSTGPARRPLTMPDVQGMDHAAAVAKLKALGFTEVEALPGGVSFDKVGAVTGTRPKAGATVPPGTPVAVFYALSGRAIVQVPKVTGMPLWRAQLALEAAQLQIGHVHYVQQSDQPQGVLKIEPSGYTLPGTPVQVTVNGTPSANPLQPGGATSGGAGASPLGGAPGSASSDSAGTRTVPFSFDPKAMGLKRLVDHGYQLKLVVRDAEGERTVLDRAMKPGEAVSMSVQVHGSNPLLQTYIDGVFFQAWRP